MTFNETEAIIKGSMPEYQRGRLNLLIELYVEIKDEDDPIICATKLLKKINEITRKFGK
jgi:hypothetical protein